MDKIVVVKDCESYTPGLGNVKFAKGAEVFLGDPNYFPLLWAGLAIASTSDNGIAARLRADRERAKESE